MSTTTVSNQNTNQIPTNNSNQTVPTSTKKPYLILSLGIFIIKLQSYFKFFFAFWSLFFVFIFLKQKFHF
jgi:hypothetical protein